MITFISGGARSGKSSLAEKLAVEVFESLKDGRLFYIATAAKNTGEEMADRIAIHKHDRGDIWETIEEPYYIDEAIDELPEGSVILIDCLTVWTSHLMFSENLSHTAILKRLESVLSIAEIRAFSLYIVSNDVNEGVPIHDLHVMRYISCLEALHKHIVIASDTVIETVCGTPIIWKKNGVLSPYVSLAEGEQI